MKFCDLSLILWEQVSFVQEWSSETRFDHGQFEIETFLIYAPPYSLKYFNIMSSSTSYMCSTQ